MAKKEKIRKKVKFSQITLDIRRGLWYIIRWCKLKKYGKVDTTHQNGKLMSLFYHPTLDYPAIEIVTENDVRVMRPTDEVLLDAIVDYIDNLGYCFGHYNG